MIARSLGQPVTRRQTLAGAIGAGVAVVFGPRFAFAQETDTAPSDGTGAVWAKFNLNTMAEADVLTIPATGERMADEFAEYRPFVSIAQFRKEIGKYVDADIVALYERYVFVPVAPNDADAATLQQLPGVDEEKAEAIIAARPFVDDAAFLTKIGELVSAEQAAVMTEYLVSTSSPTANWIMLNLNTATEEQFLTVPGVGEQMVHEFEEYRPFVGIEQFRGEIGKYVDAEVIAGYERYLFVPVNPNDADAATLQQLPGVDEEKAQTLADNRPYESAEAFLATLKQHVSAVQSEAAAAFLAV